jgi:hypothetical protein
MLAIALPAALAGGRARAAAYAGNPGNYSGILRRLKPGDTLHLAPGRYAGGLRLSKIQGTRGRPVVISGPAKGVLPVFTSRGGRDTVTISSCAYLVLRNVKLDGSAHPGCHAINCRGGGHHVTLENLTIVNHGASQQCCGLAANDGKHYWNWTVRGCHISAVGTGMYLGNNSGRGGFSTSLIENNVILDSVGYNIEFKVQKSRPDNVPEGPTIIRNNVFSKLKSASGGRDDGARPNLLVDPFPTSGRGAKDIYLIYGNFFYQNYESDALFQGTGNIALYSNVMVNERGSKHAVHIQSHNGRNRKIRVFFNTIVAKGNGVRVSSTVGDDQVVFGNAIFARRPLSLARGVKSAGNVTGSYADAAKHLAAPFAELGKLDLRPRRGALGGGALDTSSVKDLEAWNLDFEGGKRTGNVRGAYAAATGAGDAPWTLGRSAKGLTAAAPKPQPKPKPKPAPRPVKPAPKPKPAAPPSPPKPRTPDQICRSWLSLGRSYAKMGMKAAARKYFQRVIDKYPKSQHAKTARAELARL